MKELANKIQAVINTLELLNMPSTYDNANRILGIYSTLLYVRDALQEKAEEPGKEDREDGRETDAE